MDKKRLNIALLVSEFEDGYTRSLCEGAVSAAKELDANLFYISRAIFGST